MAESLRVLVVEDSLDDADLLLRELHRAGYSLTSERVASAEGIEAALTRQEWDIVISDHGMPAFSGVEALQIVRRLAPDLPFIFVSGSIGEDIAVAAMRAGAQDYVMKDNIRRLVPAIGREIRESAARRQVRVTEEQLRATGELLRAVFSASPLAIIATDLEGRVTLWNPAAERLFGWSGDEVLGKRNPVVPEEARDSIEKHRAFVLQGGSVTIDDAPRLRKGGTSVDVMITVAATYDRLGAPDGVTISYQDLTEPKRLQAQFLQAQKLEVVGRFAGGIAHDFNNLLLVIEGYAELLQLKMRDDDPWQKYLTEIRRAGDSATALSRQLLSFSRQRVAEPKVIDVNHVVGGAVKLASRLLGSRIEVDVRLGMGARQVKADAGHVEQIIMNLVVNARDAMPDGGTLQVATQYVPTADVRVEESVAADGAGYAVISVSDTGTGMDDVTQARMFEPFFTTKPADKGTGLGLATVHGLVKQYEGFVQVESAVGDGTTFRIYLPVVHDAVEA